MTNTEQAILNRSLKDALKIARRLTQLRSAKAHAAAVEFTNALRQLGAQNED